MDNRGYIHQPTYRNNNDLEAYDYDENEDLNAMMQNLNDKKKDQSALMKRLERYKIENSDLNKDLQSAQFKQFDFTDLDNSANADFADRDFDNSYSRNQKLIKGNSLKDPIDPESRLGFKY